MFVFGPKTKILQLSEKEGRVRVTSVPHPDLYLRYLIISTDPDKNPTPDGRIRTESVTQWVRMRGSGSVIVCTDPAKNSTPASDPDPSIHKQKNLSSTVL